MVLKAVGRSNKVSAVTCQHPLMLEYRYGFLEGQFQLTETCYMPTDTDWMCLNCLV